jgi:hypothetical protein
MGIEGAVGTGGVVGATGGALVAAEVLLFELAGVGTMVGAC